MDEEILRLAQTISGGEESELLGLLCRSARLRWEACLRPGLAAEECGEAFLCAAAFTAAADLAAVQSGGGTVESFTAGEISVKTRETDASPASALRETAELLMRPYTGEDGFCFKGVRG